MRILITRPEPAASRTAERLAELGHESVVDSLLSLEPAADPKLPSGNFDAIAVTSANAIRAAAQLGGLSALLATPVFAVGARTAEAAKQAGFEKVVFSQGDASDLARLLVEQFKPGARILHLAGEHRAREFSALLAPAGIEAAAAVLYRMQAAASLSAGTKQEIAQGSLQAVLHYSPRSAGVFVTLMQHAGLDAGLGGRLPDLRHLCLSRAVAAPILSAGGRAEIAAAPDENALLALI